MHVLIFLLESSFLGKKAKYEKERDSHDMNAKNASADSSVDEHELGRTQTSRPGASPVTNEQAFQHDIMISYCHADKELTYNIHKFLLDQGFKVWIDLDNMYGPGKIHTSSPLNCFPLVHCQP
jgi:hypothetical protein